MKKTRMLIGLVVAAVLFAVMTFAVSAEELYTDTQGIVYTLNENGTATVTSGTSAEGDLSIPATVTKDNKTYTVTRIGEDAFKDNSSIGAVTLPDTVEAIVVNAFQDSSITSINIPSSVDDIMHSAFGNCKSLASVTFADGNTNLNIENAAFVGCDSLESITLNRAHIIPGEAFSYCGNLQSVVLNGFDIRINGQAFTNCGSLTSVTINYSGNVLDIASDAFPSGVIPVINYTGVKVQVGQVTLNNGEYTTDGITKAAGIAPTTGGYACFYNGNTLELNGFEYTGGGNNFAVIYCENVLVIKVIGTNKITTDTEHAIFTKDTNLKITGEGMTKSKLELVSNSAAICTTDLSQNFGTLSVTDIALSMKSTDTENAYYAVYCGDASFVRTDIDIESNKSDNYTQYGIYALKSGSGTGGGNIVFDGCTFDLGGNTDRINAIESYGNITMKGGSVINALAGNNGVGFYCGGKLTLVDGTVRAKGIKSLYFDDLVCNVPYFWRTSENGVYKAGGFMADWSRPYTELTTEDHRSVQVGEVVLSGGEYTEDGKIKSTTAPASGEYAYFKDGVLTLNGFEYTGVGINGAVIDTTIDLEIMVSGAKASSITTTSATAISYNCKNFKISGGTLKLTAAQYGIYNKGSYFVGDTVINGTKLEIVTTGGGQMMGIYGNNVSIINSVVTVDFKADDSGSRHFAIDAAELVFDGSSYNLLCDEQNKNYTAIFVAGDLAVKNNSVINASGRGGKNFSVDVMGFTFESGTLITTHDDTKALKIIYPSPVPADSMWRTSPDVGYKSTPFEYNDNDGYEYFEITTQHIHSYTYTAQDNTIIESCTCGHNTEATIMLNLIGSFVYNGESFKNRITVAPLPDFTVELTNADITFTKEGAPVTDIIQAGTYTASITVGGATATLVFTIEKATPNVTELPTASSVAQGMMLSASPLTNGEVKGALGEVLTGTFAWKAPDEQMLTVEVAIRRAVFTPTDANYTSVELDVPVEVYKEKAEVDPAYLYYMMLLNSKYEITTGASEGGIVTPGENVKYGNSFTVSIIPNEGYEIVSVTIDGVDMGAITQHIFTYVNAKHTVYAEFGKLEVPVAPAPAENPFTDIDEDDEFYADVMYVLEHGLMNGTATDKFSPDKAASRAMLFTILWRLEGEPEVDHEMPFDDVANGLWYTEAVRWAASAGIAEGWQGKLSPNEAINREELAAILYRYVKHKGGGFVGMWAFPLRYDDAADVSEWAYAPLCYMTMHGIFEATDGMLLPKADATRSELAIILHKFMESLNENN